MFHKCCDVRFTFFLHFLPSQLDDLRVFRYLQCLKLTCREATKLLMMDRINGWNDKVSKDIDRSTTVTMECDDKGLDIDISWWHKFMDSANVRMQIFTRISCKPSDDISHAHLVPESCGSMILTLNTEHWISVGISGDGIRVSWCRCTRCSHTDHAVQSHQTHGRIVALAAAISIEFFDEVKMEKLK